MAVLSRSGQVCRISVDTRRIPGRPFHHSSYKQFSKPTACMELHSFVELVNQLTSGTNMIAGLIKPFIPLLSAKNKYVDGRTWPGTDKRKGVPNNNASVNLLWCDKGHKNMYWYQQARSGIHQAIINSRRQWHLVQAGLTCLTDTESAYAVTELELLAVTWAIWKCRIFLMELQYFDVIIDHNPLISILTWIITDCMRLTILHCSIYMQR